MQKLPPVATPFDDPKAEILHDPAVRAEYDARADEFEIASELIAARPRAHAQAVRLVPLQTG